MGVPRCELVSNGGSRKGGDRGSPKTRNEFSGVHGRGAPKAPERRTIRREATPLTLNFFAPYLFLLLIISDIRALPSNGISG